MKEPLYESQKRKSVHLVHTFSCLWDTFKHDSVERIAMFCSSLVDVWLLSGLFPPPAPVRRWEGEGSLDDRDLSHDFDQGRARYRLCREREVTGGEGDEELRRP